MNFGEKLKKIRTEKNMTQPQMAEAIGIEQSYLSKLENDKSVPSAEMFQTIIKNLELDARAFLADIDHKILHGVMRQIPEVALFIQNDKQQGLHRFQRWLLVSTSACVLGATLIVAGYMGLILPKTNLVYSSIGLIKAGEPSDILDRAAHYVMLQTKSEALSGPEQMRLIDGFKFQRVHGATKNVPRDLGYEFDEQITEGEFAGWRRHWSRTGMTQAVNVMENNLIILLGVFLSFAGLFGFVLEFRLRRFVSART